MIVLDGFTGRIDGWNKLIVDEQTSWNLECTVSSTYENAG